MKGFASMIILLVALVIMFVEQEAVAENANCFTKCYPRCLRESYDIDLSTCEASCREWCGGYGDAPAPPPGMPPRGDDIITVSIVVLVVVLFVLGVVFAIWIYFQEKKERRGIQTQ